MAASRTPESKERILAFHNLHTGERLKTAYWCNDNLDDEALAEISHVLRDHRSGEVHPIDPRLLDLLFVLHHRVEGRGAFEVISGYRSPASNAALREASSGVARKSLHMQGKAIDIRLPGTRLASLHKAALSLKGGGVGFYAKSKFIHVDTGRVRSW